MSAISTYLQRILNAIWARDVRQAIHDAISQCYDDVNAPALQTEAMQAAVQAKIDAGEMAAMTIADRSLTGAKLATGAITMEKIAGGVIPAIATNITDYTLVMGTINGTTGQNSDSTNRCRTSNFIHFEGISMRIVAADGYKISGRKYNEANNSSYIGSAGAWGNELIVDDDTKYYRLVIAKTDDSTFNISDLPEEVITITAYKATDTTLSIPGKAADAKATGDAFKNQNEHIPKSVETLDVTMLEKGGWSSGNKDEYRSANRARTKTFLYAAKSINVYKKHTHSEAQVYVTFYTISGEISSNVSWAGSVLIPEGSIFTLIITESNSSSTTRTVDELYDMFHVSIADKDVISDYDSDQWTFSAGYIGSTTNMMFDANLRISIDQYFVADHRFAHFDCASGYALSLIGYDDKFGIVKTAAQFGSKTGNVFVDMEGCAFFRVTVTCPNADVTEQDVIDNVSISKNGSTGVGNANIISISKDGINDENKDYAPKYPKSSLVSLQKAYDQGFRDVVLHVQFTSDNIPVVYHDPYINRYARNADGSTIESTINIKDTTLEALNTYDFGIVFGERYRGTKITVFEDALILCKNLGFKIWIEPTTTLSVSEENIVFDMMKKYGMDCRMAYFSYYLSNLVRAHQKVPRADLLFHPSGDSSELEENLVANIDNLSALIDKNDVYAYVSGGLTDETKLMLKNAGIKRMVQCLSGFEPTNIEGQLISNKDCNAVVTQIMPAYSVNM